MLLRSLTMSSLKILINPNMINSSKCVFLISKRSFYSPSSLGINSFIARREKVQKQNNLNWDVYKKLIKETCARDNVMIFSSDIFKAVYFAENKEDLNLVYNLLKRLKSQKLVRVENYNFGPEVMRLHYLMNRPLEAMLIVEDSLLYSEFKSSTSFTILLDILFENNLYEEVIRMYHYRLSELGFNTFLHLIYFAACYKLNTKDSFQKAFELWQGLIKIGYNPGLRIRLFFAALSLNQNQLFCAMEVLPLNMLDALSINLKCVILARSKRFYDTFESLKEILAVKNLFILRETIAAIEKEICGSDQKDIMQFQNIKEKLSDENKVKDQSLDEHLYANLEIKFKEPENKSQKIHTLKK